jgi:hypothetical protein
MKQLENMHGMYNLWKHTHSDNFTSGWYYYICYLFIHYIIPSSCHENASPTSMGTINVKSSRLPKKATIKRAEAVRFDLFDKWA